MAEQSIKPTRNTYKEQKEHLEGTESNTYTERLSVLPNVKYTITNWSEYLRRGKIDFDERLPKKVNWKNSPNVKLTDFYFHGELGSGGFGSVSLIERKDTKELYAVKLQRKMALMKHGNLRSAMNEKWIQEVINSPFTLRMEAFLQDNVYLYFIMPLMEGGDVLNLLQLKGKFDEHLSRFYAAQVLLALEYLHYLDLIYRDIKPENLLLDREGYLRVADYGFVKQVKDRTYTFCGTPEYIAPEIIESRGYGKAVDYWSFGILLYEFNSGSTPFYSEDASTVYEKTTTGVYTLHPYFSTELRDIIRHLIVYDITRRYGNLRRGVDDIKDHDWFKKIIWLAMVNKAIRPPFVPSLNEHVSKLKMHANHNAANHKYADF